MKCEKSFKRTMLTYWGLAELHKGRPYAEVMAEMRRLNRLTIPEIKKIRAEQKGK